MGFFIGISLIFFDNLVKNKEILKYENFLC